MKIKPLNECKHIPMKFKLKENKLKENKPTAISVSKPPKRRDTKDDNNL